MKKKKKSSLPCGHFSNLAVAGPPLSPCPYIADAGRTPGRRWPWPCVLSIGDGDRDVLVHILEQIGAQEEGARLSNSRIGLCRLDSGFGFHFRNSWRASFFLSLFFYINYVVGYKRPFFDQRVGGRRARDLPPEKVPKKWQQYLEEVYSCMQLPLVLGLCMYVVLKLLLISGEGRRVPVNGVWVYPSDVGKGTIGNMCGCNRKCVPIFHTYWCMSRLYDVLLLAGTSPSCVRMDKP